jgi:hypothetical protein
MKTKEDMRASTLRNISLKNIDDNEYTRDVEFINDSIHKSALEGNLYTSITIESDLDELKYLKSHYKALGYDVNVQFVANKITLMFDWSNSNYIIA